MAADRIARLSAIQGRMAMIAGGALGVAALAIAAGGPLRDALWPREEARVVAPVAQYGFISAVTGEEIRVIDTRGREFRLAAGETMQLRAGMRVITGEGSVADVRVGDNVRMRILAGTELSFQRVSVSDEGETDVQMRLESGAIVASVREGEGATRLRIETQHGVLTTVGADFRVALTEEGLLLQVLGGDVRHRSLTGEVHIVRAGQRFSLEQGLSLRELLTEEEIAEIRSLTPYLAGRVLEMEQPAEEPTQITHRDHEDYLREVVLQFAEWFVNNEGKAVLGWVTDPFWIADEDYTRRELNRYLDEFFAFHTFKRIDIEEDEIVFRWDEDYRGAVALFEAYIEVTSILVPDATQVPDAGADHTQGEQDCVAYLDIETRLTFVWDRRRWWTRMIEVDIEVLPHARPPRGGR